VSTILLLLINLGIAWWNCYAVGSTWPETKAAGGFTRVLAWCGAIQSAVGFSMAIGAVELCILKATGHLPPRIMNGALSLWYLLIIVPVIGSGLAITIQSWITFWRERTIGNFGVTAWNTYAQLSNMYQAIDGVGAAFKGVGDLFSSSDEDDDSSWQIAVALVAIALLGGVLLTRALIFHYAGRRPLVQRQAA